MIFTFTLLECYYVHLNRFCVYALLTFNSERPDPLLYAVTDNTELVITEPAPVFSPYATSDLEV